MPRRVIADRRILLTGASAGIGAAMARQLAAQGAQLIITARRSAPLDALAAKYPDTVFAMPGDLTDSQHRQALINEVSRRWGSLDLLINNAGIGAMGAFMEADPERVRKIFELNFFAAVDLCRKSYPLLKQGDRPAVMNVSSVLAHRAVPFKSEYCASKFALHGFSDALRAEWRRDKIDVVLVSPSTTDSEFFDAAIEDTMHRKWKGSRAMSPERVARESILAWRKGKHEAFVSRSGRALVWIDRLWPSLANRLVARFG
jgi:short-subunit dehydrogenase